MLFEVFLLDAVEPREATGELAGNSKAAGAIEPYQELGFDESANRVEEYLMGSSYWSVVRVSVSLDEDEYLVGSRLL